MKVFIVLLCVVILAETILLNGNYTNEYIYNSLSNQNTYSLISSTLITTNTTFIPSTSYTYNNTVNYTFVMPNVTSENINYTLGNRSILVNAYDVYLFNINRTFSYIYENFYFSLINLRSNITRNQVNTSYSSNNYTISIPRNYTNFQYNESYCNDTIQIRNHTILEVLAF